MLVSFNTQRKRGHARERRREYRLPTPIILRLGASCARVRSGFRPASSGRWMIIGRVVACPVAVGGHLNPRRTESGAFPTRKRSVIIAPVGGVPVLIYPHVPIGTISRKGGAGYQHQGQNGCGKNLAEIHYLPLSIGITCTRNERSETTVRDGTKLPRDLLL